MILPASLLFAVCVTTLMIIFITDFHQCQEYLKKDFEILENWFYDSYMVLNSLILVNMNSWALGKPVKMRYLPIMKFDLKKTTTNKLLGIIIDEYLSFNKHNKCMQEC